MSRVFAEKFNQLHLAVTKITTMGGEEDPRIKELEDEIQALTYYKKMFRDSSRFQTLIQTKQNIIEYLQNQQNQQLDINEYLLKVYEERERNILQKDYAEYENDDISQQLLDTRWNNLSQDFIDAIVSILDRYGDWRYPAADLFTYRADLFSRHMTAHEPLYVVNDSKYHNTIKKAFNPFFADNRLCLQQTIQELPENQLGFAVCINTLEYLPLDYQGEIFQNMYNKIMPGGNFLISFNNCDFRSSLEHTLEGLRRYSTKDYTLGKAYSMGYDCEFVNSTNNGTWNYALLKKPGTLKSRKRSTPIIKNYFPRKSITRHDGTVELMNRMQYEEFRSSAQARQYYQIPFDNLP